MTAFWTKFLAIDKRFIYLAIMLALTLPLFLDMDLPIDVSPQVREVYEQIEALPEGAIVWISFELDPAAEPESAPMIRSLVRHLLRKQARIVIGGFRAQGPTLAQRYAQHVFDEYGAVYGVDYLNFGYRDRMDTTMTTACTSFVDAYSNRDINNLPLTDFPLMADLHSAKDLSMAIVFDMGLPSISDYIFYWRATGTVEHIIGVPTAANISAQMVNYNAGLLKGILGGMSGAAQYEVVLGIADSASKGINAQSIAQMVIVLFVILGNIGHFITAKQNSERK